MPFFSEAAAFLFWFVYGCFFEWVAHRQFMHRRRIPLQDAFRGHMEHHRLYRGDHRFESPEEGRLQDVDLRWYAFPLLLLGHLPVFAIFQWLTGLPTFWGAVTA